MRLLATRLVGRPCSMGFSTEPGADGRQVVKHTEHRPSHSPWASSWLCSNDGHPGSA
jgi:hypothetical protein